MIGAVRGVGTGSRISLLVCDDHRMLTDALAVAVGLDPDLRMVADPVHDGEAAVAVCEERKPDVVLMDVQLEGAISGLEATRRIKRVSPGTRVVILTGSVAREEILLEAVDAGASGVLDKVDAMQDVLGVVKMASEREVLVSQEELRRLLGSLERRHAHREAALGVEPLTQREREVLELIARGLPNDQIASRLFVSVRTVRNHVQNILRKLGVHSKLQAAAFAVKNGLVSV